MSKAQQISEIIEKIGWGKYNIYLFILMALSCMQVFMGAAMGSITTKEAKNYWGMSKFAMGQIGTAQLGGIFSGSFIWGNIANHHGRIMVFRISLGIAAITFLLYTFANQYYEIIPIIFVQGMGFAGILSTAPPTYYECCPPRKAWTMVLISWSLCLGLIVANLIAFLTALFGDLGIVAFRWVSGTGFVMSSFTLGLSWWVMESPRYLDLKGKSAEASEILKKIAQWNKSSYNETIATPIISYNSNIQEDDELEIEELIKPAEKVTFAELFSIHHYKKSISLASIGLFGDIGYFGMIEFMPFFLNGKVSDSKGVYGTILIQVVLGSTGTFFSTWLINTRLGRRWTVIISFLCCGVFSFLFLIADSWIMVVCSSVLIYFFNYVGYSAFFLLIPENYPTNIRAIGQSWVNAASKFGGVVSPFTLGFLIELNNGVTIGVALIALAFGMSGLFGLWVKETRGRGMDAVSLSDTIKD